MKLNKELMTRWIEALESGRYRQGRGVLKRTDDSGHVRYCCLGVLQKLEPKLECNGWTMLLPTTVRKNLGCDLEQSYLVTLNDGDHSNKPQSFKKIAQYLREKYKIAA